MHRVESERFVVLPLGLIPQSFRMIDFAERIVSFGVFVLTVKAFEQFRLLLIGCAGKLLVGNLFAVHCFLFV